MLAAPAPLLWAGHGAMINWKDAANWAQANGQNPTGAVPGLGAGQPSPAVFANTPTFPQSSPSVSLDVDVNLPQLRVNNSAVSLNLGVNTLSAKEIDIGLGGTPQQPMLTITSAPNKDNALLSAGLIKLGAPGKSPALLTVDSTRVDVKTDLDIGVYKAWQMGGDGAVVLDKSNAGIEGTINVGSRTEVATSGPNKLTVDAAGTMEVRDGANLTSGKATITFGSATVEDDKSSWNTNGEEIEVGNFGGGDLNVYGGKVNTARILLDGSPTGPRSGIDVDVEGQLAVHGPIDAIEPEAGGGDITIERGGKITSEGGTLGGIGGIIPGVPPSAGQQNNTSTVTINDGTWTLDGGLTFGGAATVKMLLSNSGKIAANQVVIIEGPHGILEGGGTDVGIYPVDADEAIHSDFRTVVAAQIIPETSASKPIGTLTIGADFDSSKGVTLLEDVGQAGSPGQSDRVVVTGDAKLGGTLQVSVAAGTDVSQYTKDTRFVLLTANSIDGTFSANLSAVQNAHRRGGEKAHRANTLRARLRSS